MENNRKQYMLYIDVLGSLCRYLWREMVLYCIWGLCVCTIPIVFGGSGKSEDSCDWLTVLTVRISVYVPVSLPSRRPVQAGVRLLQEAAYPPPALLYCRPQLHQTHEDRTLHTRYWNQRTSFDQPVELCVFLLRARQDFIGRLYCLRKVIIVLL